MFGIAFFRKLLPHNGDKFRRRISELEKAVRRLERLNNQRCTTEYYFQVEKIQIDKIIVEKCDLNNNFANLGIKALSGILNIGANYGPGASPPKVDNFEPDGEDGGGTGPDGKEDTGERKGPRTTISYGK